MRATGGEDRAGGVLRTERILITGARGLLGTALVPYLRERGYDIWCHGRGGDVEIRADLCDPAQARAALDEVSPNVIVNLAALTNVDACERSPQQAYRANVRLVENLTSWMRDTSNGCHLVQLSTDQVYDGPGPHREDDITLSNYYGFSKYAGELAAASVDHTILRTNFFGPSRCVGRMSLSDWLVQSMANSDPITVFEDVRFSPLSLQSLVSLLEVVIAKKERVAVNVGSRDGMSKADFAFALAEVMQLPTENMKRGTSEQIKLAAYRPKDMTMDSSRFETAFGVELPTLKAEIQSMRGAYAS